MSFQSNYALVPLGEVARFINGDRSTNYPKGDDYVDDGAPFISATELHEGRVDYAGVKRISSSSFERLRSGKIQRDDVLFCLRGSIGKIAYVKDNEVGAIASSLVIVRATERIDSRYLFFGMSSQAGQQAAVGLNNGAAQPNLSVGELQKISLPLPPLPIQRRIASILSAYDELIGNCQRRIKLLELMARALYREWFVHFRFPGHESVPRIPSPLGKVPKGWEVTTLGRLVDIRKGKNITKDTIRPGKVPVVAGGITPAYFHDTPNTRGPVVTISASGANAGFVNLYYHDVWASDCSYIDLVATSHIFYYYLWLDYRRAAITHLQRGSAQPHVYPKDLASLEALRPPEGLLTAFNSQVGPMFGLSKRLAERVEILSRTRDLLLPRLLSGQIDVEAIAS